VPAEPAVPAEAPELGAPLLPLSEPPEPPEPAVAVGFDPPDAPPLCWDEPAPPPFELEQETPNAASAATVSVPREMKRVIHVSWFRASKE